MNYLNIIGLIFNFVGSLVLGVGIIKSKERIQKESTTYYNGNPFTRKFFYKDRKMGIVGIVLLILGFLLQIISFFVI